MKPTFWLTIFAAVTIAMAAAASAQVTVRAADLVTYAKTDAPAGDARPITIVAARNGVFSGKVDVTSPTTIKGLRASVTAIMTVGAAIPAANVQIRYGVAWGGDWNRRKPNGEDILLESPPTEVVAHRRYGAKTSVWVTVRVPADAKPGVYTGTLTVRADRLAPTSVPIEMTVTDWALPVTQDFATWIGMIQSPDSLALEYDLPLWSFKHWELIARSFDYMGELGCRSVFIPILARTNFGNAESMVRWIRKPDGGYTWDFSIMDGYLDIAAQYMGEPKMVVFQVWELYLAPRALKRSVPFGVTEQAKAIRQSLQGKGPRVTVLDEATGATEMVYLPRFEDPASEAIWQPLFTALRARMAARGLEDTMMLGVISDVWPSQEEVALLKKVSGNLPWVSQAHPGKLLGKPAVGNRLMYKSADIGYEAHVYNLTYQVNPDKGRRYGWRHAEKVTRFARNGGVNTCSWLTMRLMPEFNITGGQSGIGRIGADVWYVVKDKRGRRVGAAYDRYPEVKWRNLDIESWMLAPGPEGPIGTARLENFREGLQECEARIAIERALLDPASRKKLGEPMAKRCEALLNDRQRAMWRTVWSNPDDLDKIDIALKRNPIESLWYAMAKQGKELPGYWDSEARKMRRDEAAKGHAWFVAGPWQKRNEQLFTLAGEIARALAAE